MLAEPKNGTNLSRGFRKATHIILTIENILYLVFGILFIASAIAFAVVCVNNGYFELPENPSDQEIGIFASALTGLITLSTVGPIFLISAIVGFILRKVANREGHQQFLVCSIISFVCGIDLIVTIFYLVIFLSENKQSKLNQIY